MIGKNNRKGYGIILLLFVITLILAGCNSNQAKGEKKPAEINNRFLMYEEKYNGEEEQSIGDLYLVSEGEEKEKIASDVLDGFYYYINSQDKVLFINNEHELYEFKKGKEKSKLAKDVVRVEGDYSDNIVTYQNSENDLYIINGENNKDKISSSVTQYELIGNYIYYLDDDGDLSKYNIKDKQETEIDNDVFSFTSLSDKEEIAYLDDDYSLYYKNAGDEESIKITSDEVSPGSIKKIDSNLVYYNIEDEGSYELYISPLSKGGTSKKIASEVSDYQFNGGYFYYVNNDGNLYKKKENEDNSTKLASDVFQFQIEDDTVFFTNEDQKLFKLKEGSKPEKISSSVLDYDITAKGDLVYQTDDFDLYVNDKKVASGIKMFGLYFDHLAFAGDDDKLYLMENMGEKKVIEDDLNKFSNAYYQNKLVYSNQLTFEDIAGVWKAEYEGEIFFLGIEKNGRLTRFETGEVQELSGSYAGYHFIEASAADTYITFSLAEDKSLTIEMDEDYQTLSKSTKAEAEDYYKQVQLEIDKSDISYLMDRYLTKFSYAVNYGEPSYIEDYLDPASALYKEQINFVTNAYEQDITEDLEDYQIESINNTAEGIYVVTIKEVFTIYSGADDYEGTEKTFKNSYTVKKIDGEFFISDIKVSQGDSGSSL